MIGHLVVASPERRPWNPWHDGVIVRHAPTLRGGPQRDIYVGFRDIESDEHGALGHD